MNIKDIIGDIEGEISSQKFLEVLAEVIGKMHDGESVEYHGYIFRKTGNEISFLPGPGLISQLPVIESFPNIWERSTKIDSYWIFLLEGIHLQSDKEIFSEVCMWEKLHETARVELIEGRTIIFQWFTKVFRVDEWPCIIVSNIPDPRVTNDHIKFEAAAVKEIQGLDDGLPKLLTKLHTDFSNKKTVPEIKKKIRKKRYWEWTKKGYEEVKDWRDAIATIVSKTY